MTRKGRPTKQWPTPLRARDDSLGAAMREYLHETENARGESDAYESSRAACTERTGQHSGRLWPALSVVALAGVLSGAVLLPFRRSSPADHLQPAAGRQTASAKAVPADETSPERATKAPLPARATPAVPEPALAAISLGELPARLPTGRIDVGGQAMALLSQDALATARTQTGNTEIILGQGTVDLRVLPRAPGHEFVVRAEPYEFRVVGTEFRVTRSRSRLELVVKEGTVAVWRKSRRLASVGAGRRWATEISGDLSPSTELGQGRPTTTGSRSRAPVDPAFAISPVARPSTPSPSMAPAPSPEPSLSPAPTAQPPLVSHIALAARPALPVPEPAPRDDCGALAARRSAREALACYQAQAAQEGLVGETAQYEVGRLWRDAFREPRRAIEAFKVQRSRFPHGALRMEADLSIIELLPRVGRHAEALAESEHFLATHPAAERRGELRLLRGNIFREALHDYARAEREYAQGAEWPGRTGDDCRFLRAVCLEAQGRVEESRAAYRDYLSQSGVAHTQEAKARLEHLSR